MIKNKIMGLVKKRVNVVDDLESQCKEAGTTLAEVCRLENIDRTVLVRWKQKEPHTLVTLRALQSRIAKVAAKKP